MSDKPGSRKKAPKRSQEQASVLGSLPATRPTRLGRHAAAGDGDADAAPAMRATRTAARKPRATTAASKPRTTTAARKPRAATSPPPPPPPTREPAPEPPRRTGPPSGPELVTTAVQAVGEIARIGAGIGLRAVRDAVRRLPRP